MHLRAFSNPPVWTWTPSENRVLSGEHWWLTAHSWKSVSYTHLAATLLLGACTQEECTNEFPQENIPISFSGNVPVMRSVKEYSTTSDLETIGVFAYFTYGNFNEDAATPNFMYNPVSYTHLTHIHTLTDSVIKKHGMHRLTDIVDVYKRQRQLYHSLLSWYHQPWQKFLHQKGIQVIKISCLLYTSRCV